MKLDEVFESQLLREAHLDGVGRLVAGAVVVRKGRVLLLRRRYDDFMGGFYELPSGVAEAGETLGQALYREVEEETGLLVEDISAYLGCFSYLSGSETRTRQFNFLVTVADFSCISLTEHDAFTWACPADLARWRITEAVRSTLEHPALKGLTPGNLP